MKKREYFETVTDAAHLEANFINAAHDGDLDQIQTILNDPEFDLTPNIIEAVGRNIKDETSKEVMSHIFQHNTFSKRILN